MAAGRVAGCERGRRRARPTTGCRAGPPGFAHSPAGNYSSARKLKPRGTRETPGFAPQNLVLGAKNPDCALKKAQKRALALTREAQFTARKKNPFPIPPPRGMKPGKSLLWLAVAAPVPRLEQALAPLERYRSSNSLASRAEIPRLLNSSSQKLIRLHH